MNHPPPQTQDNLQYEILYLEYKEKYDTLFAESRALLLENEEYKKEIERVREQNSVLRRNTKTLSMHLQIEDVNKPLLVHELTAVSSQLEECDAVNSTNQSLISVLEKENKRLAAENREYMEKISVSQESGIALQNELSDERERLQHLQEAFEVQNKAFVEHMQILDRERNFTKDLINKANAMEADQRDFMDTLDEFDKERALINENTIKLVSMSLRAVSLNDLRQTETVDQPHLNEMALYDSITSITSPMHNKHETFGAFIVPNKVDEDKEEDEKAITPRLRYYNSGSSKRTMHSMKKVEEHAAEELHKQIETLSATIQEQNDEAKKLQSELYTLRMEKAQARGKSKNSNSCFVFDWFA